jgi:hypothetical protein
MLLPPYSGSWLLGRRIADFKTDTILLCRRFWRCTACIEGIWLCDWLMSTYCGFYRYSLSYYICTGNPIWLMQPCVSRLQWRWVENYVGCCNCCNCCTDLEILLFPSSLIPSAHRYTVQVQLYKPVTTFYNDFLINTYISLNGLI